MAATVVSSFFWNNGQYYGEDELTLAFGTIITPGVMQSELGVMGMAVSKTNNNSVSVAPGIANLSGCHFMNLVSASALSVTNASSGTKSCMVVARADFTNKRTVLDIINGSSASDLTRNSSKYEICLATMTVGTSGIVGNLTDTRSDTSLCGPCRAKTSTADFNAFYNSCNTSFTTFMNSIASKTWRNIAIQNTAPSSPASGSLWVDTSTNTLKEYSSGSWVTRWVDGNTASSDRSVSITKTKSVTVGGNYVSICSATEINTWFGKTVSNPTVIACNGDYSAWQGQVVGVYLQNGVWNAKLDGNYQQNIRVNYTVFANV